MSGTVTSKNLFPLVILHQFMESLLVMVVVVACMDMRIIQVVDTTALIGEMLRFSVMNFTDIRYVHKITGSEDIEKGKTIFVEEDSTIYEFARTASSSFIDLQLALFKIYVCYVYRFPKYLPNSFQ